MEENTGVRGNERRFLLSCFRRFPELTASDKPGKLVGMTLESLFPAKEESSALPRADDLHGLKRGIVP